MDTNDRSKDIAYGIWPWIAGIGAGALLIWLMFHLATGFA